MRLTLWVICVLNFGLTSSQSLIVKNANTDLPIADVFVYHESKSISASSNSNGVIDLSNYPNDGRIIFQHPSFEPFIENIKTLRNQQDVFLKERVISFDDVLVSANRWSQNPNELAQEITAVRKKEIQFLNPSTSADLLEATGEVYVQKSQLGGGSPMLRGFAANSVLLVVDGVRLNNAIYRSGNLQNIINIDPNALSQAEVIYGPGSIIYGSDALGGVMSFSTISPDWSEKPEVKLNILGRYSSASNETTGNFSTTISREKFTYFGAFSYSTFGDLKAGSRRSKKYEGAFERNFYVSTLNGADFLVANDDPELQVGSGFDMSSVINKVKFKTSEYTDLEVGLYISRTTNIPRYDQLTRKVDNTDSLRYAEWYYGPQSWLMNKYTFNYFKPNRLFDEARMTLAYQRYEESRNDRRFGSQNLRTQEEKVDLYTANIDFSKSINTDQLYYGFDFFTNDVSSTANQTNQITQESIITDSRYPNGGSNYASGAAYINYLKIFNRWTVSLGARYSMVNLEAKTNNNISGSFERDFKLSNQALNGMVGVVFQPSNRHKWSGILSSGFRAPNVDDVGKLFEITDDLLIVPNAGLKPEYSYNQELSYKFKNDHITVDLVGYHSLLDNAIVRGNFLINGSNTIIVDGEIKELRAQINQGRARIVGSGLSVKVDLGSSITASSSFNISKGRTLDDKEPLRHVPPAFGRVGINYQKNKLKLSIFSLYNLNKKPETIPSSEFIDKAEIYTRFGSPGWITFNIQSDYRISDLFNIQAGIENILDQHYRTYSSGISAAGRNFYITLRAQI